MDLAELLVSWLPSAVEEQFGSRVSICAEVISPTSADRSDWTQHLLRAEAFELRLGTVAHPQFHNLISVVREFAIKCRLC